MPSEPGLTVRRAVADDAEALAALYLAVRDAAVPSMPPQLHPPDDVRRHVRSRIDAPGVQTWLAEEAACPVAMLVLDQDWVDSLYVAPGRTGEGIGTMLLDLAKSQRPEGLGLWVFTSNLGAQRFYRRHGFFEIRRTDGSGNEERQPDIEMRWPGVDALAGLRRRMDEVDDRLAELLAERSAITAAVQAVKAVPGHAGRDPDREQQIAARMARRAPALGVERLRRIMHVVIGESLDASEGSSPAAATRPPAADPEERP
jgi:chorismate mutase/GNAT superfamily N-acetyltransferase